MSVNPIERRTLLRLAVATAMAAGGLARVAHAQPGAGPAAPVERLNAALVAAMKAGRPAPFGQRFEMVAASVDQVFDLDAVLRTSVGPRWATLPADQQDQLRTAFRRYTIANYVANFDSYAGETFQIAPETRAVGNGDQVVTTRIVSNSGSVTVLGYVMRQTGGGWRAVDVLADGAISRVAVQRSDFRSELTRGGGTALVASLQRKVADLSGGALA
ncbi:ABC transporter substrate-binding protein [Limobrevibacterium gyesilva]|uniref:ABC transporter substrate-binding protein n=1 Tax=Limobrevibacterium gyesilva TaxID=2991712 RepID=A0AA42CCJ1_9PROT|nr:ABC transporter substrate-binding protein [Limobrevibacterium gyesilva]MCW3473448.1 ABC transporter substrate-binding protein [Limobrevibacterium gyesilva]